MAARFGAIDERLVRLKPVLWRSICVIAGLPASRERGA